ncbi:hypothetical protein SPAB_00582 [Salmonella enterica subsp. enterica serovar Paratyphi B str. SPB7]|uniref:Uncharacterized protein n=1 Tax=Salmonella paratyphi B (strain ATCC BAA-1250 / SPB7) TaxID=1016998 RepID=A0A6C6YXX2_SALPB|nr:hypothetical protein SPAB_00582 [Salmonella enterica subsp. enterica serovar Paratyphi B str. SPB7]
MLPDGASLIRPTTALAVRRLDKALAPPSGNSASG